MAQASWPVLRGLVGIVGSTGQEACATKIFKLVDNRIMMPRLSAVLLIAFICGAQDRWTTEKEAGLGAQLASEIRRTRTIIENPGIQEYVDGVGQKLAAQFPNARHPFTFAVIAPDNVTYREPLSYPGGYIFIPAHLILGVKDETEFARMLAHSMAHIVQSHRTVRVNNYPSIPLIFMGGWSAPNFLPRGLQAEYQRWESEADTIAAKATAAAGFEPTSAALAPVQDELRRLTAVRPKRPPSLLRPNQ